MTKEEEILFLCNKMKFLQDNSHHCLKFLALSLAGAIIQETLISLETRIVNSIGNNKLMLEM